MAKGIKDRKKVDLDDSSVERKSVDLWSSRDLQDIISSKFNRIRAFESESIDKCPFEEWFEIHDHHEH